MTSHVRSHQTIPVCSRFKDKIAEQGLLECLDTNTDIVSESLRILKVISIEVQEVAMTDVRLDNSSSK